MKTKLHLLLILSVVLILLLFVSCSENEPTVTSAENTTTTGVTTTVVTDYYSKYENEKGCYVVNIPIAEISVDEIRKMLKENVDNFDCEKEYIIYPSELAVDSNASQVIFYMYLEHNGAQAISAYRITLENGKIRLIRDVYDTAIEFSEIAMVDYTMFEDETFLKEMGFDNLERNKIIISDAINCFCEVNSKYDLAYWYFFTGVLVAKNEYTVYSSGGVDNKFLTNTYGYSE